MDETVYGDWSSDYIAFLVTATFTAALYVLIVGMLFVWAIKALRS